MSSSDKELELQLLEAGNKLSQPPPKLDDLISLLNQLESCLVKVEQSPSASMQNALAPSLKALVADQVFGHSDTDVKVAVASCISEITRITAPDAPYEDDKMKDVFQLIVSSFENLADKSSRSYSKRTSILETVAKVRSCVVMLDLECESLIIEMFQHFLRAIRDYHPDNIFSSMETIMSLVLEESEDISVELLFPLLDSVKKGNENVLPIARKLGEKVLESSAGKVKPYLIQALRSSAISLDDYGEIVASLCQEPSTPDEQNGGDENKQAEENKPSGSSSEVTAQAEKEMAPEEPSPREADLPKSPKSVVSNGVTQAEEDDSLVDLDPQKKDEDSKQELSKSIDGPSNAEADRLDSEKEANTESKAEQFEERTAGSSKPTETSDSSHPDTEKEADDLPNDKIQSEDVASSPQKDPSIEVALSSENQKGSQPSSPKAVEGDAAAVIEGDGDVVLEGDAAAVTSSSASGNLPDESLSKKAVRSKKKEKVKESAPLDDVPQKEVDVASDLEEKPHKSSGQKNSTGVSLEDGEPMEVDESKIESGTANESEDKSLKQSSEKVDDTSNNADGPSLKKPGDKRQRSRRKPNRGKSAANISDEAIKEKLSSPKSSVVSTKDEPEVEETPKTSTKRKDEPEMEETPKTSTKKKDEPEMEETSKTSNKRKDEPVMEETPKTSNKGKDEPEMEETPKTSNKRKSAAGLEKGSSSKKYDGSLVGTMVKVWWPMDKTFYEGIIKSFDVTKKKHLVLYNDGEVEVLNLRKQKWEVIAHDSESDEEEAADQQSSDATPEMPVKKKAKTDQGSKQGKVDASPKKCGVASSKSKSTSTKSSKKAKEVDSKSPDDSKNAKKTEDGDKTKDQASKTASKSKNDDLKASKGNKSKEDVSDGAPKASKSKRETPKSGKESSKVSSSSSKAKSSKGGEKSDINGSGKLKSSSSKAKESEDDENSMDSGETLKSLKVKSGSSGKAKGSGSKSSKKRRRA